MSLFDQINEKKAVFFEDYISFVDNFILFSGTLTI